jgi:hypothetical protein
MQPLEINCFDDKPQRRADGGHILVHDALHNCRFAGIIKSTIDRSISTFAPVPDQVIDSQH